MAQHADIACCQGAVLTSGWCCTKSSAQAVTVMLATAPSHAVGGAALQVNQLLLSTKEKRQCACLVLNSPSQGKENAWNQGREHVIAEIQALYQLPSGTLLAGEQLNWVPQHCMLYMGISACCSAWSGNLSHCKASAPMRPLFVLAACHPQRDL